MSLYTKGTWRRFHLDPTEMQTGWALFATHPRTMFGLSALMGRADLILNAGELDATIGINPPHKPRMDCGFGAEQEDVDRYLLPQLATALRDEENKTPWDLPTELDIPADVSYVASDGWSDCARDFFLFNEETNVIGFWLVCWGKQELEDKASLREDKASGYVGMPYKLISNEVKKGLFGEEDIGTVVISRKQVPVIVDLNRGDVWLGSASTKFAKALTSFFGRGMALILAPAELHMGGVSTWVPTALNAIREHDLFKLEREEALERALHPVPAPPEDEDSPEAEKQRLQEEMETAKHLSALAAWAPDNGGEVIVLQADANLTLKPDATSTVVTSAGPDALELFMTHPNAELVMCSGEIALPPPPLDDKGDLAHIHLDFSAELTQGIYRNVEFTAVRSMWLEMLEEPFLRGVSGISEVVDSTLNDKRFAHRYSRYWFRYYLQLQALEQHLIHGFASALDLDPSLVTVTARALFAKTTPGTTSHTASEQGDAALEETPFQVD